MATSSFADRVSMDIEEEKPEAKVNKHIQRGKCALGFLIFWGGFAILEIVRNLGTLAKGIFFGIILSLAPIMMVVLWYEEKSKEKEEDS